MFANGLNKIVNGLNNFAKDLCKIAERLCRRAESDNKLAERLWRDNLTIAAVVFRLKNPSERKKHFTVAPLAVCAADRNRTECGGDDHAARDV